MDENLKNLNNSVAAYEKDQSNTAFTRQNLRKHPKEASKGIYITALQKINML